MRMTWERAYAVERSTVKLSTTSAFLSVVFVSLLSMRLLAQVSPGVQEIDENTGKSAGYHV